MPLSTRSVAPSARTALPLPPPTMRLSTILKPLLLWAFAFLAGPVFALDEVDEVKRLHGAGQTAQALQRAEAHLAGHPKDAAMRFVRGVLLADSARPADAIQVYEALIQDLPELAEPYNNLAALQAAAGEYDKARLALEQAVRAQPAFALAHQNLGDVLATLAARSYARALQLDPSSTTLPVKLALVRQLAAPATPAAAR